MKTKFLDFLSGGTATIGITTALTNVNIILGCVASIVAILTGCISIYLKIKAATADGKITPAEVEEIKTDAEKIKADGDNLINNIKELKK